MSRILHTVVLLLLLAAGCPGEACAAENQQQKEQLCAISTAHQPSGEAILSDAQSIYRVCSSRPERILPGNGALQHTVVGRAACCNKHLQTLYALFRGKTRSETAPFSSKASCKYYVFALRHLLC